MAAVKPHVVVTHWVHPEVQDYLAEFCDPVIPSRAEGLLPKTRIAELAQDSEGLIVCMADSVDDDFLARCRRLRVISATLKGYDNFDVEACTRRGVWLTIVPETIIPPTAELTVGLLIGVMRRVAEGHDVVRSGEFAGWRPNLYGATLQDATIGVIGMGQLGQAVAQRLRGFDARLHYHDAQRLTGDHERRLDLTYRTLHELIEESDAVVVLIPLTDATRHLIGATALQNMRSGAYLVNVGRGSVIDEEAVADALESGRLGGYAADVFAMEDWALPDRPTRIAERLRRHPRTLLTPHLGSAVDDVRRTMSLAAARQVRQVFEGRRPDYPVNTPSAG